MDFLKMMKQAKEMQGKMQGLQEDIAQIETTGTSGGGKINLSVLASGELKTLTIDPSLLADNDAELLEDLIMLAHKDALDKAKAEAAAHTQNAMGGLQLPAGMKLPF